MVKIARDLVEDVNRLRFRPPVAYVYNPLEYAWEPHRRYLELYGRKTREILLTGMNPGPWGMAQTGVPFGDVGMVRGWLGVEGRVKRPRREHPKRPVEGFDCHRREVSGQRLWGWAKGRFGDPERFFDRFMVWNYCPLCFLEKSGRNRTPEQLPARETARLFELCDRALLRAADELGVRWAIGIGRFAERRIKTVLADRDIEKGFIPHPSPASPQANRGWSEATEEALEKQGIRLD